MYLPFNSIAQIVSALKAANGCGSSWLLAISHHHCAEMPDLLAAFRDNNIQVCGGIFPGLIAGGQQLDEGMLAIRLPHGTQESLARIEVGSVCWEQPLPLPAAAGSAILLVDNQAPNIAGLLEHVYDHFGGRISHIGAGTGFPDLRQAASIFSGGEMRQGVALLLTLPLSATVQVRHGWKRVAGPFVASRTHNNLIQELNWEPAGDVYRREIARLEPSSRWIQDTPSYFAAHPLSIARDGGEDVVRDPLKITDANELVVLSDVVENSVMYLAGGDQDSLARSARLAIEDCGHPENITSCLVVECYSRALLLGDEFDGELRLIADQVARITDLPPEGLLALGEIAGNGKRCLEFHNKTFAIAFFQQPSSGS